MKRSNDFDELSIRLRNALLRNNVETKTYLIECLEDVNGCALRGVGKTLQNELEEFVGFKINKFRKTIVSYGRETQVNVFTKIEESSEMSKSKGAILKEEAENIGLHDAWITGDLRQAIFLLADWATENYTKTNRNMRKNQSVPDSKTEQYRKICRGVLMLVEDKHNKSREFRDLKIKEI